MKTCRQGTTFSFTALLATVLCIPVHARADEAPRNGTSSNADSSVSPQDQRASIAAFLADKEGKQTHDFPVWNDYKKIVGDTPASRGVFAEMLRAEPELCAAVGGDSKRLVEEFIKQVDALQYMVHHRTNVVIEGNTIVDYGVTLPQMTAIILVAARSDVTSHVNRDWTIHELVGHPPIIHWRPFNRDEWQSPDSRRKVIKLLMTRWVVREAGPHTPNARMSTLARFLAAQMFLLEDAKTPLALEILRHPKDFRGSGNPFISAAIKQAFATIVAVGDKDNRRLLEPFLKETWEVRDCISMNGVNGSAAVVDTPPQARDLALGSIVQLSGVRPEDYSLKHFEVFGTYHGETVPVCLFSLPRDRNRGFDKCIKNYRELGLREPPPFTPGFTFVRSSAARPGIRTSPDGKVRLELRGSTARLIDVASGQPIGKEIDAGTGTYPHEKFAFTCCAFSADGKYVVTGSGYVKKFRPEEDTRDTNIGQVEVWEATTGELVERYRKRFGAVLSVKFSSEDGRTILFDAERFSLDIS
jgi:hypothetical protein